MEAAGAYHPIRKIHRNLISRKKFRGTFVYPNMLDFSDFLMNLIDDICAVNWLGRNQRVFDGTVVWCH